MSARSIISTVIWVGGLVALVLVFWLGPRDAGPKAMTDRDVRSAIDELRAPADHQKDLGSASLVAALRVAFESQEQQTRSAATVGVKQLVDRKVPPRSMGLFVYTTRKAAGEEQIPEVVNAIPEAARRNPEYVRAATSGP
jgi:hypothetical protein